MTITSIQAKTERAIRRAVNAASAEPFLFLSRFWNVKHPTKGAIPLEIWEGQKKWYEHVDANQFTITLKGRQSGISTIGTARSGLKCLTQDSQDIIMLSRTEREAVKLIAKIQYALDRLPPELRERFPVKQGKSRNQLKIVFDNDSSIEAMPSLEDPGRGASVAEMFVDEWAFFADPEETWASIYPISDHGGKIILLTTFNNFSRGAKFVKEFWEAAQTKQNNFLPLFIPWQEVPGRDEEWYIKKKRDLKPWQLAQEYPSTAEQAFLESGTAYYNREIFSHCKVQEPDVYALDIHEDGPGFSTRLGTYPRIFTEMDEDVLRIFEPPDSAKSYAAALDVSEGLESGDWSVLQIASSEGLVAKLRTKSPPEDLPDLILPVLAAYGNPIFAIERNNHGYTVVILMRHRYDNLYTQTRLDRKLSTTSDQIGWYTNKITKPLILDKIQLYCKDGFMVSDDTTLNELKQFARLDNGKTGGRPYDDCVMSLGICLQMLDHLRPFEEEEIIVDDVPPKFSMEWWEEFAKLNYPYNQSSSMKASSF